MGGLLDVLTISPGSPQFSPAPRVRQAAFKNALQEHGCTLRHWSLVRFPARSKRGVQAWREIMGQIAKLMLTQSPDLVWLQREAAPYGPAVIERMLSARWSVPIVFDFDDAIWLDRPGEAALTRRVRNRAKFPYLIRHASHVFAGNQFLADYALTLNSKVTVVPSVVDTNARYDRKRQHFPSEEPVIGWIGSRSTLRYLKNLNSVFDLLQKQGVKFTLAVICDEPPRGLSIPWTFIPWSDASEIENLLTFDIGLMPLDNSIWEKGKCAFKIIQYMACGVPPVASDVGANRQVLRHGVDGFLCHTDEEWARAIGKLLSDHQMRMRMGGMARERIVEYYSVQSQVSRIAAVFREVSRDGAK